MVVDHSSLSSMDMAVNSGRMAPNMKVNGAMGKPMAKELSITSTEMFMKGTSLMIEQTVKESIITKTGQNMWAHGSMI